MQNIPHQTPRERQLFPSPNKPHLVKETGNKTKGKEFYSGLIYLLWVQGWTRAVLWILWRPWLHFSGLHLLPRGRKVNSGQREGWKPAGQEFEVTAMDSRAGGHRAWSTATQAEWMLPGGRKEEVCTCFSLTVTLRDGVFTQRTGQRSPVPTRSCQLQVCTSFVKHLWTSCLL